MNIEELLQKSIQLQQQGYRLIENIGLLEKWQQAGKPVIVGSIRFGLMLKPNIDIEIYTEKPHTDMGFDIIREFARLPGVRSIRYINAMETPDQGFYWRIDYTDEKGVLWDIDNWLVGFDHPNAGLADGFALFMEEHLKEDQRRSILRIKDSAIKENLKVRSIDIYKAVLKDGIEDYRQFCEWLKSNPPAIIEEWTPHHI